MTAVAIPAPSLTNAVAPTRTPDLRRTFQLTEFGENHNKWWQIEVWDLGGQTAHVRATWGRVGHAPQSKEKLCSAAELERTIAEKVAKGYRELELHRPDSAAAVTSTTTPAPAVPRTVVELLDLIFVEAGQRIASYLAVSVDALSQAQIQRGRDLLDRAMQRHMTWQRSKSGADFAGLVESVTSYYNAIPTQLPRNLRDAAVMERVVMDFYQDLGEQETRLDQLEAALATYRAQPPVGGVVRGPYDLLGTHISPVAERDEEYARIVDFLGRTSRHGYGIRVRDVFAVEIPSERRAFASNTFGSHRVLRLTHGSNSANVRHILREHGAGSGLRVPRSMTNGWMFGPGIYFANVASKSANYCHGRSGNPRMMFLADVAVGDLHVARDAMSATRHAPPRYHSVWGKAGHTGSWGGKLLYDEFIVYRQEQQTIRYLVTWDPR